MESVRSSGTPRGQQLGLDALTMATSGGTPRGTPKLGLDALPPTPKGLVRQGSWDSQQKRGLGCRRASMCIGASRDELRELHEVLATSASLQSLRLIEGASIDDDDDLLGAPCKKWWHFSWASSDSDSQFMPLAVLMVVAGCAAQTPHEIMNTQNKGCGDLISLFEYLFGMALSVPWLVSSHRFRIKPQRHAFLALLGLAYVFLSNLAFSSAVPTSVYAALKNGILFANLIVGIVVLNKRYTAAQYLAVALVSLGLVSTAVRAKYLLQGDAAAPTSRSDDYAMGIIAFVLALLSRASSGAFQERFMRHADGDVHTSEMVFMRAALGVPFFVARASGVKTHLHQWLHDPALGHMWLLLLTNLIFDYSCKVIMTTIIKRCGALTASVVLSFQKFVAFTISVVFVNPVLRASVTVWASAFAVLLGTVTYSAASSCKVRTITPISPRTQSSSRLKAA